MQQEISRNSGASSSLSTISPSFNSYSSENIADIAARVIHELNISHEEVYDDDFYPSIPQNDAVLPNNLDEDEDEDGESEFEFAVLCGEDTSSPISADEIFSNGQIKPIYPIFGQQYDAVLENESSSSSKTTRLPLRTLMSEDREMRNDSVSSSSTSSSDDNNRAVELEGVPPETYCVWAPPKGGDEAATMKKKSNSTGTTSSKRWRFKDLLHRSSSDGKETFVFLTPAQNNGKITGVEKVTAVNNNGKNNGKKIEEVKMKSSKKKNKSYLQYTPDVVGFFGNVNGINRTIRPF